MAVNIPGKFKIYNMITFWVIAVLDEVTAVTVSRFIPVSTMVLLVSLPPPPPPFNPPICLKNSHLNLTFPHNLIHASLQQPKVYITTSIFIVLVLERNIN